MTIEDAIAKIKNDGENLHLPDQVVTDSELDALETKLGVKLPADYRTFMKAFNGGEHAFARMFSIGGGVWNFEEQLNVAANFITPNEQSVFIPFASDYGADFYCFDYRVGSNEPRVIIFANWTNPSNATEVVAPNFLNFLNTDLPQPEPIELPEETFILQGVEKLHVGDALALPEISGLKLKFERIALESLATPYSPDVSRFLERANEYYAFIIEDTENKNTNFTRFLTGKNEIRLSRGKNSFFADEQGKPMGQEFYVATRTAEGYPDEVALFFCDLETDLSKIRSVHLNFEFSEFVKRK